MSSHNNYLKKFNRCILEYTNAAGAFDLAEADDDNIAPVQSPDDPTGAPDMTDMGGGNGMAADMPVDNSQGMQPSPDAAPQDGNEAPAEPPQGFSPQGGDPQAGMDGMNGQPVSQDGSSDGDEEVIDVDDLTKSQEKAEEKIDSLNARFDKLMQSLETIIQQNKERDERDAEREKSIEAEIEKRIPTPMQRLSMRSAKSSPYSMSPEEYMEKYAPDNYSAADDNNGADDPQYKITKADIDNFTDYNSIAKDLDIDHQGLKDILGY